MLFSAAFENVPLSIATYAVATAVSLLPASLIAVVALSLANASKELANRNALVRKSDAIETLAAVTVRAFLYAYLRLAHVVIGRLLRQDWNYHVSHDYFLIDHMY